MTSSKLIDVVASATSTPRAGAKEIIDASFGVIGDAVGKGEEVAVNGLGNSS